MNLSNYHNQKAYMFLSQKGQFVRAYVVVVQGNSQKTYTQYIDQAQAEYLVSHQHELELKGIHIIDNRVEAAPVQNSEIILALPGVVEKTPSTFIYESIPSPYISIFDEILFFSTQKVRGPNK